MASKKTKETRPPADTIPPPPPTEYTEHEELKLKNVHIDASTGHLIGEAAVGPRQPQWVKIEKVPAGFIPQQEVEVRVVYLNPDHTRASAELIGPTEVFEQIEAALAKSEAYWKSTLITSTPQAIKTDRLNKIDGRGGKGPRFEYTFVDGSGDHLPITVTFRNVPDDWARPTTPTIPIKVVDIQIHKRDKRLIGTVFATDFPEPPPDKKAEARKHASEVNAWSAPEKLVEIDLAETSSLIVKRGSEWIMADLGDSFFHAEARLEVPIGWTPSALKSDPVKLTIVSAKAEGEKVIIYFVVDGFTPPTPEEKERAKLKPAAAAVETAKGDRITMGRDIGEMVKGMMDPAAWGKLEPLLVQLDTPEMSELKSLTLRRDLIEEIQTELTTLRGVLASKVATDDGAIGHLTELVRLQARIKKAQTRIEDDIKQAKEVWADELNIIKRDATVIQQNRIDGLKKLLPRFETKALETVDYRRLEITIEENLDVLRGWQAENAAILKLQEEYLWDGVQDADKTLLALAEEFHVAELLAPILAARIAELESIAAGVPVPPPPSPAPAPRAPIRIPVAAPKPPDPAPSVPPASPVPPPAPTPDALVPTVEVEEVPDPPEQLQWLKDHGFKIREVVNFPEAGRRKLAKMFAGELTHSIRLLAMSESRVSLGMGVEQIEIDLEVFFSMTQETSKLAARLEAAGIVRNSEIEVHNEFVEKLLAPQLAGWLREHAGRVIPKRAQVIAVDFATAELVLALLSPATRDLEYQRVPLEVAAGFLPDKIKVVPGVVPVAASGERESVVGRPVVERVDPAEVFRGVMVNQRYRYDGKTTEHLETGGEFIIDQVDVEAGTVTILTDKDRTAARHATPPRAPTKFKVRADQWTRLPKTITREPGKVPVEVAEKKSLMQGVVIGERFMYKGAKMDPFTPNVVIRVVAKDEPAEKVKFVLGTDPRVYTLPIRQWVLLGKAPMTGTRVDELLQSSRRPSAPAAPPNPPAPAPAPAVSPRAEYRVSPTLSPAADATAAGPRTAPIPPRNVLPPIPARSAPAPEGTSVISEPVAVPAREGEIATPKDLSALVDVIRDQKVIDKVKALMKKKAPFLSALGGLVSDPVKDAVTRVEKLAPDSGATLTVADQLMRRANDEHKEDVGDVLRGAVSAYRKTEREALRDVTGIFNDLLKGNVTTSAAERVAQNTDKVRKALTTLKGEVAKARTALEPASTPAVGPIMRRSRP